MAWSRGPDSALSKDMGRKVAAATVVAIIFIASVSLAMAGALTVLAGVLVIMLFRLAAAGRPLHHDFAEKAAAVDGEMVDVISNISLVWSFCGLGREHGRIDGTISREMAARRPDDPICGAAAD